MLSDLPPDAPSPAPLLVAYSGGLDSTVLLHLLASEPRRRSDGLRAIHVHHGLHPDADDWARHCRRFCDALAIPLTVVRVEVARDAGLGLEAAARHARHAAFEAALGTDEVLVTGHHRDDQAETFLLRALRASGTDGLAAMRAWRRCGRGWLWRPLLETPRAALLEHAGTHALRWIEDPSNA
ncbi:tRNA lysidine(34) synthetase TilS, partial [Lysobacter maris]